MSGSEALTLLLVFYWRTLYRFQCRRKDDHQSVRDELYLRAPSDNPCNDSPRWMLVLRCLIRQTLHRSVHVQSSTVSQVSYVISRRSVKSEPGQCASAKLDDWKIARGRVWEGIFNFARVQEAACAKAHSTRLHTAKVQPDGNCPLNVLPLFMRHPVSYWWKPYARWPTAVCAINN